MKQILVALVAVAFLSSPDASRASTIFAANLTNSQENPPVVPTLDGSLTLRPASFGSATFVLNDAMTELTFSASVFNIDFGRVPSQGTPVTNPPNANPNPQTANILNDDLLVAHIHRGPVGTNGPVIFGFIGTPFNDNNPNDVVVTPFASGIGGTVTGRWNVGEGNNTMLSAEIPNLLSGLTYINFHTIQFGGGEVRGQITPVPEPATLSLVLLGSGLALRARLRRRRTN
jgi:CHRD domain/PEP-CTERM motif